MSEPITRAEHDAYWRPLGELLVQRGLLSAEELETALDEQAMTGGMLGEILVRHGLLSDVALASTLAEQVSGGEAEAGFGSGLRSALAGSQQLRPADDDSDTPETEGGFGSGLRRALERTED